MIRTNATHDADGRHSTLDAKSKKIQQQAAQTLASGRPLPSPHLYNLSVGETPKFIWFRNAKVGTRSIFSALMGAGVDFAAESPYGCHYFPNAYRDYFKFAFVRNPWDRFVSGWLNKIKGRNSLNIDTRVHAKLQDFNAFVQYWSNQDTDTCNAHFRRQSRLIDLNEIDYLGRIESFAEDLESVFAHLGLPLNDIPARNQSTGRQHYSHYYTDESIDIVQQLYRVDIQLFGYQFDDRRSSRA